MMYQRLKAHQHCATAHESASRAFFYKLHWLILTSSCEKDRKKESKFIRRPTGDFFFPNTPDDRFGANCDRSINYCAYFTDPPTLELRVIVIQNYKPTFFVFCFF